MTVSRLNRLIISSEVSSEIQKQIKTYSPKDTEQMQISSSAEKFID